MKRAVTVTFSLLSTALLFGCSGGTDTAGTGGGKELLRFRNASLPIAYKDEAFTSDLTPLGVGPYQLRLADGDLPPGITLSGYALSGTPTQPGSYSFTIRASDASLSSTVQKFSLAVQEQPTPVLALELPVTEVRDSTRIPLRITGARKVGSARLMWRVPEGVTVSAVSAGNAKPLTFWQVRDGKLTVDMGFAAAPAREDVLAFLSLKVAKPMKMTPGNIGFEVRSSEGKTLNKNALPELAPVVPAADPAKVDPTKTPPSSTPPATTPPATTPPTTTPPVTPPADPSKPDPVPPATPPAAPVTPPPAATPPAATPPVAPPADPAKPDPAKPDPVPPAPPGNTPRTPPPATPPAPDPTTPPPTGGNK